MSSRPTPFSIAFSALIALHCDKASPLIDQGIESREEVDAFIQSVLLSLNDNSTVSKLVSDFRKVVEDGIADCFVDWLKVAATSIDSLTDLVTTLQRSVIEGSVDATSANGVYLRSVTLGFAELSFESTTLLWKELHRQVEALTSGADVLDEQQSFWPLSVPQIEESLRQSCLQFSGDVSSDNKTRGEQLERTLQENPELPSAHFLRFLQCLQAGERVTAVEALHQYFDYALIRDGRKDLLQFASILLALMYHQTGNVTLSRLATEEAVRVAQQSQDTACVAFALGWLYENQIEGSQEAGEVIRRCAQRAAEGNLSTLVNGAQLSWVKHTLQAGRPYEHGITAAWTHLSASTAEPVSDESPNLSDRPTRMQHVASRDEALEMLARQRMVAAAIWDAFGQVSTSQLTSWIALHCHTHHILSRDAVAVVQNIARGCLFGCPSTIYSVDSSRSTLHQYLESLGKPSKIEGKCIYAECVGKIISFRDHLGLPVKDAFLMEMLLPLHEWAVRRVDLHEAEALIQVMLANLFPSIPNYREVKFDVFSQKALLLTRQRMYHEATTLAESLVQECQDDGLETQHARALLMLAFIQLEADCRSYTHVLETLFDCLTLSDKYQMGSTHAAALSISAQVHLRKGNAKRAMAVLQACLPSILQNEHVWIQGEAFLTLAKCHVHRAKHEALDVIRHKRQVEWALKALYSSEHHFHRCQDMLRLQEIYYLESTLYNDLSDINKRDIAASKFCRVSQVLNSPANPSKDCFLDYLTDRYKLQELLDRPMNANAA